METGFAVTAFLTLILNLVLEEEVADEETPELTANDIDNPKDQEEWARIKGKEDLEHRASSSEGENGVHKAQ